MKTIDRVLVIGAGPAGLSAAWAIKRAGVANHVEIIEIREDGSPAGVGMLLTTTALRALRRLDLLDECLAIGAPVDTWSFFTSGGDVVGRMPLQNVNGAEVPPALGILRASLHRMLVDKVASQGARIRTSTHVTQFRQDEEGVDVVLSTGTTERYDMVVGADGLNSRTRAMLLGTEHQPRNTGQTVWRTAFERFPEHGGYQIYMHGPHRVGLVPSSATVAMMWLLDCTMPLERPDRGALLGLWKERAERYGGAVSVAASQVSDADQIDFRVLQNLIVPPPWHRGRVVLIGDAVHATTPHLAYGAGLAFEDGLVLAEEIAAAETLDDAFGRYEQRLYARSRMVVENAQALGECDLYPERATRSAQEIASESMIALTSEV